MINNRLVLIGSLLVVLMLFIKYNLNQLLADGIKDVTQVAKEVTETVGDVSQIALDTTGATMGDLAKGTIDSGAELLQAVGQTSSSLMTGDVSNATNSLLGGTVDATNDFVKGGLKASYTAYEGMSEVYAGAFE